MRESTIEQKLREAVKRLGGQAYKFISPGNSGVPDRLVVLPDGRVGFVEVKAPGETPRLLQLRQMQRLTDLGCYVAVVDDVAQIAPVLFRLQHRGGTR